MEHFVTSKTVIGVGEHAILLEVKGHSVRVKRRGAPDLFIPLESARDVAKFLIAAGAPPPMIRA